MSWWRGWEGCCACCLSCEACSFRCVAMGRILVSLCRWAALVSDVHPVIARRALFCTVWSLDVLVSEMMGDHIVSACSMRGRVIAL